MMLVNNPIPMTLEDRGVAVPFTTPMLASCRVRRDYRNRLEIVVPSLVDGRGLCVMPWSMLPEAAALTLHDRILHEEIGRPSPLSPASVREVSLSLCERGLAGARALEAAQETRRREAERAQATLEVLVRLARNATRPGARPAQPAPDAGGPRAAGLLGTGADAHEKLTRMAQILSSVGLDGERTTGRLRQTAGHIVAFSTAVDRWRVGKDADLAKLARYCGDVANHTRERCSAYLGEFDRLMERLPRDPASWPEAQERLEELVDKLTWLLDGWAFVIEWWDGAIVESLENQALALLGIFRVLPAVPVSEMIRPQAKHRIRLGPDQRRKAHLLEDWQTAQDDTELIARIEQVRAEAA